MLEKRRERHVIAVFVALIVAATSLDCERSPEKRLMQLAGELDERPTECRLSNFAFAPFKRLRGAASKAMLTIVRGKAVEIAGEEECDEHTRGVSLLISGDYDRAIPRLEEAARQVRSAATWNDLAVAYYERGKRRDHPDSLAAALGAAAHALDIDRTFAPAQFNRAVILEGLRLAPLAAAAYREYLAMDSASRWASEATLRLTASQVRSVAGEWDRSRDQLQRACLRGDQDLARNIVRQFPEQARRWGEGVYLGKWADDYVQHRNSALASLGIARCIGLALEQSSGERLLGDAVKAIDGAISDGTAATLVRAHLRYTQARKQYSRHAVQSTKDDFLTASIDFGRGRSAMSLWADSYAANVLLDEGNVEAALRLLADVETRSAMGYKALRGEIESTRALAYGRNGHLYEATESIRQALNQYESLRESDNCARLRVSLVSTLTVLGQHEEAWRIRFAILEAAASGHPRILQLALNDLLFDQYNARNWDVLAAFADETASISAPGTETNAMALMFAAYARARRSGRFEPATLAAAHAAARQIGDLATRDLVEDEIHFNEADLMMQADPRSAMRLLDDVIAYRTVRFPYRLSAAYAARGRISRHLGDLAAASVAFNRAIDELERQRATLNSQQLLADTYVGDDHRMYEDAMSLEAQRGDYDRVFSIAESTRARVIRARASAPFPAAGRESYGQIDDDTTVVSITILPDLTLLTVMTAGGMRHIRSPATSADIEVLRGSLITSMQREDEKAFRTTAQRLYATLLSPISTEINRHAKLVIVADAKVTGIPFGALVDPRNGRFVLDDHSVVVAPSVSTFLALHGAAATRPNRVLALGDPAFDSRRFPALERLSEARIEVEEVAASYAQSERLIDTAATRDRFLKACKTSDVAHLAAHEIVGRTFATSVIPLAVSADDSGLLYATDIAAMTLTRHPVVMLDGCESAVAAEGSGSVRSFATAFLAAGARSVIGTVMDVDDHDARVFAIAVHRQLRMGVPAAVALRNAQQELRNIAPGAGTRQWMAYQAYGFE